MTCFIARSFFITTSILTFALLASLSNAKGSLCAQRMSSKLGNVQAYGQAFCSTKEVRYLYGYAAKFSKYLRCMDRFVVSGFRPTEEDPTIIYAPLVFSYPYRTWKNKQSTTFLIGQFCIPENLIKKKSFKCQQHKFFQARNQASIHQFNCLRTVLSISNGIPNCYLFSLCNKGHRFRNIWESKSRWKKFVQCYLQKKLYKDRASFSRKYLKAVKGHQRSTATILRLVDKFYYSEHFYRGLEGCIGAI